MFKSEDVKINLAVVFKLNFDEKDKLEYYLEEIVRNNLHIRIIYKTTSGDRLFVLPGKEYHALKRGGGDYE